MVEHLLEVLGGVTTVIKGQIVGEVVEVLVKLVHPLHHVGVG